MKRGQTDLNFLIAINKPKNFTSHDLVQKIRNITGEGRVGHMGTLDPLATGLMLIGVGSATRLNNYLENLDKRYVVEIEFGKTTNTYDAEGDVVQTCDVPKNINDKNFASDFISKTIGVQTQIPPAFSAIKINGKAAYKTARTGHDVEMPEREIEIYDAKIISVNENAWTVSFDVSKGTYIRSLVHDIGQKIGCGAFVKNLTRTGISNISLDDAYLIEKFENSFKQNNYKVLNAAELLEMPVEVADEKMLKRINHGSSLRNNSKWNLFPGSKIAFTDKKLLAIYYMDNLFELHCECVFSGGIEI